MQVPLETAKHAVIKLPHISTPSQWFVQPMSGDNRDSIWDDDKYGRRPTYRWPSERSKLDSCSNHTSPQYTLTSSAFKSFIDTCGFLFMTYLFNKVCSVRKLCSKLKSNRHYLASGDSSFIMDKSEGCTNSYGFETEAVLKQNIEKNELGVLGISLNGFRKDDQENLNSESEQSFLDYMHKRWTCEEKQDDSSSPSQSGEASALSADSNCELVHFLISEYNSMQKQMNELQEESDSLRKMIRKMTTEKEEEMSYSQLEMMKGIIEGLAWEKDTLERFLKMKHEEVELEQEKCAEVIAFTKQLVPVELAPFVENRLLDIRRYADPKYVPEGHTASMVSAGSGDSMRNYILFWMAVPECL